MAVQLDEWLRNWYKEHPGEKLSATQAEQIFVGLCRLLQKEFPAIEASPDKEEVIRGLCPACFLLEQDQPVAFRPGARSVEYCPAEEQVDEATCLFGMGLILYELLVGDTYANQTGNQVGESFFWSYVKDEASRKGQESLVDLSKVPQEYGELGELLAELTQYDHDARPASLLEGEIPSCEYKWEAVDESTSQVVRRKSGLLNGIDAQEKLPVSLEENGKKYEAVEGQMMEISYSFLRKSYQTWYREVIMAGSAVTMEKGADSWDGSDLGLLVNDGAGGQIFAPLILSEKRDVRYRLRPECPPDYSSWKTAPPLLLTVMRRKKNCGGIIQIGEKPDAFREEQRFTLYLNYPDGVTAHPELELTEKEDGGFKIRCEWVNADGRKVGESEVEN